MKVYIIRHGEVPHNALKQYNNENEDLTKKGIKQAEELREKIKTIDYDIDYLIFVKYFFINLLYYFFVWQTSENDIFFKKLYLFHFFYAKI